MTSSAVLDPINAHFEREAEERLRHGVPQRPIHILAIDDDSQILLSLNHIATNYGHSLIGCTSCEHGLAALKSGEQFDIIFLDIRMPGQDGIECFWEIKALESHTPIVFMTAWPEQISVLDSALRQGGGYLAVLQKPLELAQIGAVLRKHRLI